MIEEGFELMLVGMGVVFSFLILMVGFIYLSGAFFTRYFSTFPEPESSEAAPAAVPLNSSERQAVALAAAYRIRRGA